MPKKEKHVGVADDYSPLNETLTMAVANVIIRDRFIYYYKKDDKGRASKEALTKEYPSRHAVQIIYGRLKKGQEAYLLSLINKIEQEKNKERIRSLT